MKGPQKGALKRRPKTKWIQKATSEKKEGALSRQLGIPVRDNIPFTFLENIVNAPIGNVARNPTQKGVKRIKVTRLLKQRANFALNVKRIRR
jgi:hypothetical protein